MNGYLLANIHQNNLSGSSNNFAGKLFNTTFAIKHHLQGKEANFAEPFQAEKIQAEFNHECLNQN